MRCTITWPIWIDPVSKDLLQRLLVLTPAHRMSRAGDVKEHRWFKSINWTVILSLIKLTVTCLGAIAKSVERPLKVPVWCNSTDVGSNHAAA